MRRRFEAAWSLVRETLTEWSDDHAATRAAALAYYTIFSVAPTLIIATAVAGAVFGADAARGEIHRQIEGLVGTTGAKALEDLIQSASKPGAGVLATALGVLVLMFAATGVFAELQDALNAFWKAPPRKTNGIVNFLRVRFLSFAMVLGIGFLLLVSLVVSAMIAALGTWFGRYTAEWTTMTQLINQVVSFGIVTLLFALIYKVLPDRQVAWKDVWLGAFVTSALFNVGKLIIGLYIAKTSVASTYGAAGSLAVILIWVYYSAMILFVGAEFTQVYARTYGSLRAAAKPGAAPRRKEGSSWPDAFPGTARSAGGR